MKILVFMLEGPISNKKEQRNIAPSPSGTPVAIIILLNFFEYYGDTDFQSVRHFH